MPCSAVNVVSLPYGFATIFFSLADFAVSVLNFNTYTECVNQLFMLWIRLLVNSRLFVVRVSGS